MTYFSRASNITSTHAGFTLPVVLLISISLLIIGLSVVKSSSSIKESLRNQDYSRLARESAEAGAVYANYCLSINNYDQSWGPANGKPNLAQNTDCEGQILASAPAYLIDNDFIHTSFSVGDLEARYDGAIIIGASGSVKQTVGTSSTVARTYSATRKQIVRWQSYSASKSASGTSKTCAVISGQLYCWGLNSNGSENFSGQLGDGTTTDSLIPVKVVQASGLLKGKVVVDVASAQFHNCALAAGKVYCWGRNFSGQLGNGSTADSSQPVVVGGALASKVVTKIGTTGNTSCAIAENKIYCWGDNNKGTVGNNTTTSNFTTPQLVSTTALGGSYSASDLSTSGSRSTNMCAIVAGKAWCWGNNDAGQIGNGATPGSTPIRYPVKVDDTGVLAGKTVTSISQDGYAGGNPSYTHVCAVASGKVYCWGENNEGQLGRAASNTTDSNVPVAVNTSGVLSGKTVGDVAVGLRHSCALAEGSVYCWGSRIYGQVGDNYAGGTPVYVPVAVAKLAGGLLGKTVTAIGGGSNRGCAIAGYTSYCWGFNRDGQIGDGSTTDRRVPTESLFLKPKAPSYLF